MTDLPEFINNSHQDVEFGVVNFAIKKYGKKVAAIDVNKNITYKTEKGNVEGLGIITQIIKGTSDSIKLAPEAPTPPSVTFTLYFDRRGEIRQVNVNDFKRQQFNKN